MSNADHQSKYRLVQREDSPLPQTDSGTKRAPPSTPPSRFYWWNAFSLFPLLVVPASTLFSLESQAPRGLIASVALAINIATFLVYRYDKNRATNKEWRTSESSLHLLALIGGWAGAFIAQQYLRHKTGKPTFQFVFWAIVTLHQLVTLDFLRGWVMIGAIGATLRRVIT